MVFLSRAIRQWGPLLGAIGFAYGVYYETTARIRDLEKNQSELVQRISDVIRNDLSVRAIGPGGFEHPQIRAGIEAQIRAYMESKGCQCREFYDAFFQLNPTLVRPNGK